MLAWHHRAGVSRFIIPGIRGVLRPPCRVLGGQQVEDNPLQCVSGRPCMLCTCIPLGRLTNALYLAACFFIHFLSSNKLHLG